MAHIRETRKRFKAVPRHCFEGFQAASKQCPGTALNVVTEGGGHMRHRLMMTMMMLMNIKMMKMMMKMMAMMMMMTFSSVHCLSATAARSGRCTGPQLRLPTPCCTGCGHHQRCALHEARSADRS